VEELMLVAAADAGLEEPFVLVHELLDHAVAYRVCGFLPSIKNLLSARSNLRKTILEQMHGNGIEIVSPAFMNQRQLDPGRKIIPDSPVMHDRRKPEAASLAPEEKIFDKAVEAASLEELKLDLAGTREEIKAAQAALKEDDGEQTQKLNERISALQRHEKWCAQMIQNRENGDKAPDA
jgi:hypothetical protein